MGSSTKRFNKIFTNDLSVNTINGQVYGGPIDFTSVSGNIIPSLNNTFKLGDVSKNWSNAYISDINASNISISSTLDISKGRIIANNIDASAIYAKAIDVSNININMTSNLDIPVMMGSGGTITTYGNYFIHTFLASGTFIAPKLVGTVEALIVGGGGSGGVFEAGGGGGGGVITIVASVSSSESYSVVVGNGGVNNDGEDSSFKGAIAKGGGRGGTVINGSGNPGGSGGGGAGNRGTGGAISNSSTIGSGNSGTIYGSTGGTATDARGGGGGGAGSPGSSLIGGSGIANNFIGTYYFWGGGGGGGNGATNGNGGPGGLGGGGGGGSRVAENGVGGGLALNSSNSGLLGGGGNGATNSGGGGGGGATGGTAPGPGGTGGSGIVVIRYTKTVSSNTINLNTIIAGYMNYVLTTRPSPIVSITIPASSGNDPGLVIPIDMVNNDSVEINLKFNLTGSYNGNELFINYKSLGVSSLFEQNLAVFFIHNQNNTQYYNNGAITKSPQTDSLTSVYTIKIHRAFINRYTMSGTGLYDFYDIGTTNVLFSGMSNTMPDAIHLTWGVVYGMNARYTITNTPG